MVAVFALVALGQTSINATPRSFETAAEPQLAIDADHRVYATYGMGNAIYVSVSSDEGASFTAPVRVADAGKLSLGMRRGPRIAAHDGTITVTATYGVAGGGKDGDLLAFRSADRGRTWSGPVRVNDVVGSAREGLHGMGAGPDGTLACAWLDLRSKGTKLFLATSTDGGANWSPNRLAYESPSGTICQCCHPSVGFDPRGRLYVMFRNVVDGRRDMYLTHSEDGGRIFAPATKLGEGTWPLDACPMDGGSLATTASGDIETVWRRQDTIYRCAATGGERRLAEGRQGWIAEGTSGAYLVWCEGARLMAIAPGQRPVQLADTTTDGVVVSSPDGKLVLAAWAQNGIHVARL